MKELETVIGFSRAWNRCVAVKFCCDHIYNIKKRHCASIYVEPLYIYYSHFVNAFIPKAHSRGNVYRVCVHAGMLYAVYRLVLNVGTCVVVWFCLGMNCCSG